MPRALSLAGQEANEIAMVNLEREATAQAKERDAWASDQIRALMYDPQTGFANLRGQDAVNARATVMERLDKFATDAMDGLSPAAQRKVDGTVRRRIESAKLSADSHTAAERRTWLDGASAARIDSAYQDSLFNPAQTRDSLNIIESEIRDKADREGWAPAQTQMELERARSKVYADQVARIANADPVAAMQYLRDHQDEMRAEDVLRVENVLTPIMKEYIGRERGREMFEGVRPEATATLAALEEAVGFPLKVISGFRDPEHNARVGGARNSQHTHGNAFDVDVKHMTIEQRQELIRAARAAGFSGIGVYNNSIHFDVGAERHWGPSYGRESTPAWALEALQEPVGDRPSAMQQLLDIEDPVERDAALNEYELRANVEAAEQKQTLEAAQNAAFQMIEGGGSLADLPVETRQALGQPAMTALRSYEKTIRSGGTVQTDPATYYELRQLQASDPAAFRSINLVEYRDRLSDSDWQEIVKLQTPTASDTTGLAASTIMSTVRPHLRASGIEANSEEEAAVQTEMLRWQDAFIASEGRKPTPQEIDTRIGQALLPVVVDPPGLWNREEGTILGVGKYITSEAELEQVRTVDGIVSVDGVPLPAAVVSELVRILIEDGQDLSYSNIAALYAEMAGG